MPRKKGPKPKKTSPPKVAEISLERGAIPMIDIGANLLDGMFQGEYHGKKKHPADLDLVVARAHAVGVKDIIVTAGTLQESRQALELTQSYTGLYSTVGVHPTRCDAFDTHSQGADDYTQQLLQVAQAGMKSGAVVAIGECGLDYARTQFCTKETQLRHFPRHFYLSEQTGLPLFLHCRDAAADLIPLLRANRHRFTHAVVHSFDGTLSELKALTALGLHIGVNGCSLKTPQNLSTMAQIPDELLLLETDAPWCGIRSTHAGFSHIQSQWPTVKNSKYTLPEAAAVSSVSSDAKLRSEVRSEQEPQQTPVHESKDSAPVTPDWKSTPALCVKGRSEPCHLLQVLEVMAALKQQDKYTLAATVNANTRKVFSALKQQ